MGLSLKSIGRGIKHVVSTNVRGLGRTAKKAAPFVAPALALTGVGLPFAAAIGAGTRIAGGVAAGDNMREHVRNVGRGALEVGTAGALSKAGSVLSRIPGGDFAKEAWRKAGGLRGVAGNVLSGVRNNADALAAGAAGVQGARLQGQAEERRKQALRLAEATWAERAPLRESGRAGMMAPPVRLERGDYGNPYGSQNRLRFRRA